MGFAGARPSLFHPGEPIVQVPLVLTFHNVERSQWAEDEIRGRVAELERIYGRLNSCRVRVDQRTESRTGSIPPVVRIELGIPGHRELVVSHEPEHLQRKYQRPDLRNAIHQAFHTAERLLREPIARFFSEKIAMRRIAFVEPSPDG
jgi:hypothetical protein